MVQKVCLQILLIVVFYAIEFFDNFILAEELFPKALQILKTSVLVNNNLCAKLFSSLESPATFDESFKVASVPFFIPDFNLLSCKLDNFTFLSVILSHFILILYLKKNKIIILSQFILKNLEWFLFLFQ